LKEIGNADTDQPEAPNFMKLPQKIRPYGNTGPKGVLADYAEAKERARIRIAKKNEETWNMLEQKTITLRDTKQEKDEEEEEEEDFFEDYKEKRLRELKALQHKQQGNHNSNENRSERPTFGYLRTTSVKEFVGDIEKENSNVFVVVHLYEEFISPCVKLNKYLHKLAIKYPFVKFLKFLASESNYDSFALPTILIYRAGNVVSSHVRITSTLGNDFDSSDIEILLGHQGVIALPYNLPSFARNNI